MFKYICLVRFTSAYQYKMTFFLHQKFFFGGGSTLLRSREIEIENIITQDFTTWPHRFQVSWFEKKTFCMHFSNKSIHIVIVLQWSDLREMHWPRSIHRDVWPRHCALGPGAFCARPRCRKLWSRWHICLHCDAARLFYDVCQGLSRWQTFFRSYSTPGGVANSISFVCFL